MYFLNAEELRELQPADTASFPSPVPTQKSRLSCSRGDKLGANSFLADWQRAASLFDPGREFGECCFLRKNLRRCADARRNPIGERDLFGRVPSRTRVDLAHLRQVIRRQPARHSDESRPHPPMDKRDLALVEATYENIIALADRPRHREDLVTLRMTPPTTSNWLSSDDLGKRRARPLRGLKYNTVLANESESLACSHRHDIFPSAQRHNWAAAHWSHAPSAPVDVRQPRGQRRAQFAARCCLRNAKSLGVKSATAVAFAFGVPPPPDRIGPGR